MTKRSLVLAAVLAMALLLSLAGPVQGAGDRREFRLKLSAGVGILPGGGGDLETLRQGWQNLSGEWERSTMFTSSAFDWRRASFLSDLRVELLLAMGRNLGFSLGCGVMSFSSRGDISYTYDVTDYGWWVFTVDEDRTYRHQFEVKTVPLELNVYYFLPLGGKSSLYAYAGPGVVLGKLDHEYEYLKTYVYTEDHIYEVDQDYARESENEAWVKEEARGSALGLQGGMGWELRLASYVSIGIESSFRLANIKNWEGTGGLTFDSSQRIYRETEGWGPTTMESRTEDREGWLWYFSGHDPLDPYSWDRIPAMFIQADEPQGEFHTDVRRAGISLSGFRICLVLQFHL